jgi:hypothetical protein
MPDVGQNLKGRTLDTLSEWIKGIQKLSKSHIHHLSDIMMFIFLCLKKPEVVNILRRLYANFVLVPADRASNNIIFAF